MKMQQRLVRVMLCTGVLLSGFSSSQAQRMGGTTADSKMQAGGAGSSGGFSGLYTPNLYDGSANISVPIYQYSADEGEYGVALSYNTRGIKVDQIASAAGLGWEIISGPSISRVIKDMPDELNIDLDTLQTHPVYDSDPGGDIFKVNTTFWTKGKFVTYSESGTSAAYTNIYRDGEADDFVVNLGGSTFTFNLGEDNYIFTNPRRNVKVELLLNGNPITSITDWQVIGYDEQQKLEFRITDENGTQYLFVRGDYEQKTIEDEHGLGYPLAYYWVTTRWVIKEVILATGSKITYTYDPIAITNGTVPAYKSYSFREGVPYGNYPTSKDERATNPHFAIPLGISYPNGVALQFQYGATRTDFPYGALAAVQVNTSASCLSYKLRQSYFYSDTLNAGRLRLDSIKVAACDGTMEEPLYSFSYDPGAMPKRMSVSQDWFGYYNAAPYAGTFSPDHTNSIPYHQKWNWNYSDYSYGIDRNANPGVIQRGILKKIKNAYGGEIAFYYSSHNLDTGANVIGHLVSLPTEFDFTMSMNADDGLRLDSVVEKEQYHTDNSRTTRFIYSGGQRFLTGGYFYSPMAWKVKNGVLSLHTIYYTNSYITAHHLVGGSNHGYSNVTVETRTGGNLLSKMEYIFTNFKDATSGNLPRYTTTGTGKHYFQYPFTDKQYIREWEMGLPLLVAEYDQNNQLVRKTINEYNFLIDSTSSQNKVENRKAGRMLLWDVPLPHAPNYQTSRDSLDYYRPYRGQSQLVSSVLLKYVSNSQYIADTSTFGYDGRGHLASVITSNSRRQKVKTVTIRNYDVATQSPAQTIHQMNQADLEKTVGTERWLLGGSGQFSDKLLDATINTYSYQNGKLLSKGLYALEAAAPIDYSTYTGYSGGPIVPPLYQNFHDAFAGNNVTGFQKTSEVQQTDSKGNPVETLLPMSGQYKAMIWDTVSGRKLAEASCRLADFGYSGFEASHQGSFGYNPAGVTNFPAFAGRNTFAFSSGSVTRTNFTAGKEYRLGFWSTTAPACLIDGSPITLVPGAIQGSWRYYEGVFIPATTNAVLSITGAANKYLDELRLYPSGAALQCWSHDPLFGVRAGSDLSGRMIYYEYDKLGRQTLVRDQEGNVLSKTEFHIGQ